MVTLIALPSDVLVPIFKLLEDKELLLMRKVIMIPQRTLTNCLVRSAKAPKKWLKLPFSIVPRHYRLVI